MDKLADPTAYEWKTGASTWGPVTSAIDIIAKPVGQFGPMGQIDVKNFSAQGKGYLLLEQYGFGGNYRIWQSATPGGTWTQVKDASIGTTCTGAGNGCYAIWGHPQLSTKDHLLYSYYSMKANDKFVRVIDLGTVPDL